MAVTTGGNATIMIPGGGVTPTIRTRITILVEAVDQEVPAPVCPQHLIDLKPGAAGMDPVLIHSPLPLLQYISVDPILVVDHQVVVAVPRVDLAGAVLMIMKDLTAVVVQGNNLRGGL